LGRQYKNGLRPATIWVQNNPIYALIAILTTIGEFIGLNVAVFSLRGSRRREREERMLKEEQVKLNREISDKLSGYKELFADLEINRQHKQFLTLQEARIAAADSALAQRNLSIESKTK